MSKYERKSDVDGFTIVYRVGRAARIHLLRPWNSCNTEKRKSGRDTESVKGSRENLLMALSGTRAIGCKRCFLPPSDPQPIEETIEYADSLEE